MSSYLEELKVKFSDIKKTCPIPATRRGPTGIGKTFEDALGKIEDNAALPDYKDIEIKTQREASTSMITLFTKSPDYPRGVNTFLREQFGEYSAEHPGQKILHTTVVATKYNTHRSGFNFKIDMDDKLRRLILSVQDNESRQIVYNSAYWNYSMLEYKLKTKLKYIAYIHGLEVEKNGINCFNYTDIKLIKDLSLESMLEAIKNGDLCIDLRIGVFNSGKKFGKTHDHGTGFRITLKKLMKYADVEKV